MRYEHIARMLEAARFDGCFFADTLGLPDIYKGSFDTYLRYGGQLSYLDPMIVLPVMARATRNLGLGATLSTTFHHPYHLLRPPGKTATILKTKGRADHEQRVGRIAGSLRLSRPCLLRHRYFPGS